jgi:hypothetical protein
VTSTGTEPAVSDNLSTDPGPSDALRRLIRALQPTDDAQRGLLVVVVTMLGTETSSRLASLVERSNADAYDRGYRDRAEGH